MSDHPIDLATFRALEDTAGAAFVAELVDAFLEEAPRILDELPAALAAAYARAAAALSELRDA